MIAIVCLGFSLSRYRPLCSIYTLCLIFGSTHRVCVLFLRFALRFLVKVLSRSDFTRVRMPTKEETQLYEPTIKQRLLILENV